MEQDLLNHTLVYVSRCEDGTTEHDFVQINHVDEDLGPILEELIQIQQRTGHAHIATGTLMQHSDAARDACRCLPDREETFEKILTFLRSVVLEHPGDHGRLLRKDLEGSVSHFATSERRDGSSRLNGRPDISCDRESIPGMQHLSQRRIHGSKFTDADYVRSFLPCGLLVSADGMPQLPPTMSPSYIVQP